MKYIFWTALLIIIVGFVFRDDIEQQLVAGKTSETGQKKEKRKSKETGKDAEASIVNKWQLPEVLREVSGIAWMDENRFACIQDEEGTIYIYDHAAGNIEKEIPFAGRGDYEGITLNGDTAYVVRSDGQLYQVPMNSSKKEIKEWRTPLTANHNVEGLFYDKDNHRLLLAVKDGDPGTKDYKGIYAFNLAGNRFVESPVYKIDLQDELLQKNAGKKKETFKPSAIAIHPQSKALYIVDGPSARLMLMQNGKAEKVYYLGKDFPQAEGITFSPRGELFISSEGKKTGVIVQTALP